MNDHKCELCGQPVRVVGDTTLHYEPVLHYASAPEQLTRPEGEHSTQVLSTCHLVIDRLFQRIESLKTTILEQSDQIESLSAECERYRRVICDIETCKLVGELSDEIAGYLKLSDNLLVFVEWQAARIEHLTWAPHGLWPDDSTVVYCRHCGQYLPQGHTPGCPAGEE